VNPPRIHAITDPQSGRSLTADIRSVGDDIVIIIGGGTHPHVGAVVLACPVHSGGSDVSALIVKKHREEVPARSIAEKVCQACRQTTVVTLGIHEDDLDRICSIIAD